MPALVLSWSDKARLHADLAQKFLALEAEIVKVGKRKFTEDQLNDWHSKVLGIEAAEPPTLSVLEAICHNDIVDSLGEPERKIKLNWCHKSLMHIFDFNLDWSNAHKPRAQAEGPEVSGATAE